MSNKDVTDVILDLLKEASNKIDKLKDDVSVIKVKLSIIGILAGLVGGIIVQILIVFIEKMLSR